MVDTHPGDGSSLRLYWTKGAGLAKWAESPTPYTTLLAALRKAGVPENLVHGLAANYYHDVFGKWPGANH